MKRRGGGGPGAMGGMQQLMKQANQMQSKVKKLQEELAERNFTGSAGGGAVSAVCNGDSILSEVKISPDVLDDTDMLQDLVLLAVNEAIKTAKETSKEEMDKITGGMGGGLF